MSPLTHSLNYGSACDQRLASDSKRRPTENICSSYDSRDKN